MSRLSRGDVSCPWISEQDAVLSYGSSIIKYSISNELPQKEV